MLKSTHRFHGYGSLRFVYKNGEVSRNRHLITKISSNPHRKNSRVAIVVSKKVHKSAVGRNRIRRRLYEIVRSELPKVAGVHDIAVIVVSSEVRSLPSNELVELISQCFDQAGLYKKS